MKEQASSENGTLVKSAALCRKAAEEGNTEAQCTLGSMYKWGSGVKKDLEQAVYWYKKAAKQGHEGAKAKLAELLKKHP